MRLPERLDGLRVVVTGGAGFVGSWVCERLVAADAEVTCLDSLVTGARAHVDHLERDERFRLVVCDVTEPLPETGPVDWVLHLASPASPAHYQQLPLETLRVGSVGTTQALELAQAHGARFLLASTSEVYGDPDVHPQGEDYWGNVNPVGPRSVYDEAKRYAEAVTAAYRRHRGVDTAIARIFNTYGPRMAVDDGRMIPVFVERALDGRPLPVAGDGSQTRSLCYVEDTVEGLLRLAASSEPGPVNIGAENEVTVADVARRVIALTGSSSQIRYVDLPEDDPRRRRPELTTARQVLSWDPVTPLDDGLRRTIDWMRRQRPEWEPTPPAEPARAG